jgi:hypothetical protein
MSIGGDEAAQHPINVTCPLPAEVRSAMFIHPQRTYRWTTLPHNHIGTTAELHTEVAVEVSGDTTNWPSDDTRN